LFNNYYVETIDNGKKDIDHIEKAHDVSPTDTDVHAEQDWTPEEEKAVVYVSSAAHATGL
jgi:hypothetical protein